MSACGGLRGVPFREGVRLPAAGFALVCMALLGSFAAPAGALISGLEVIPAYPTASDSVTVRVSGWLSDPCWKVVSVACGAVAGENIGISLWAQDSWRPGLSCVTLAIPYDATCRLGRLLPGDYLVTFIEYHNSLRQPSPEFKSLLFSVAGPLRALPNPFTTSTRVPYVVTQNGQGYVQIAVFDLTGRRIRLLKDAIEPQGVGEAIWDGSGDAGEVAPPGLYFVRGTVGGRRFETPVVRLR